MRTLRVEWETYFLQWSHLSKELKMEKDKFKPVRLNLKSELKEAMKRPGFKEAWESLDEEYAALSQLLGARLEAGLTQEQIADRMGTTKSVVSRLESSLRSDHGSPSFSTLRKYAHACGKKLIVRMV